LTLIIPDKKMTKKLKKKIVIFSRKNDKVNNLKNIYFSYSKIKLKKKRISNKNNKGEYTEFL